MNLFILLSFRLELNIRYISLQRCVSILFDGLKLNQKGCYLIGEKKERRNKQVSSELKVEVM